MYIECWSGLASRIITLAEACYIQKKWGKESLKIVWPIAEDCRISFYDVFDHDIFEDISWKLIEYKQKEGWITPLKKKYEEQGGVKVCLSRKRYVAAIYDFLLLGIIRIGEMLDFSRKHRYQRKESYFDTTEMYGQEGTFGAMAYLTWERIKEQLVAGNDDIYIRAFKNIIYEPKQELGYSNIRFKQDYYNKVKGVLQNRKNLVGVQIRRTDHIDSIGHSLSSRFEEKINQILEENPETYFFLATDDKTEEAYFKEKYGEKILIQEGKTWNRSSKEGMQAAVVDFLCLASCQYILGSYNSTFGEIAAKYGGIEEIVI